MKFSVCLPTGFEGLMHPIPFVEAEDFVPLGRECERLGYDSVWGNDHFTTQNYVRALYPDTPPRYYEVLITLTAIAMSTARLRLGTALLVPALRDPVLLAKQAATLDQLSGGRFILGVGVGAYREEFDAWAPRMKEARRGDMLEEALAALTLLFRERRASFAGRYYAFEGIEMFPKPRQAPFPIWVGGHNLAAVERAARWGAGWLPGWRPIEELAERIALLRRRAAEHGRDPDAIEVAPEFSVTVGKTMEAAAARYMASGLVAHRQSLAYTGRDLGRQVEANLVGTPDVIREKIARLQAIGVQHCCALMFPADTMGEMREQVAWFAESVIHPASSTP
jgi:probable F420-dependent oxidoreductase